MHKIPGLMYSATFLFVLSGCSPGGDAEQSGETQAASEAQGAQATQTISEDQGAFPSNAQLAGQNVVLRVRGWTFGGGIKREKGNGLEIEPGGWNASGVLVDANGTIVTNYHVAARALEIEAHFDAMAEQGGASYKVPFIKVLDKTNDLAILKIDGAASFQGAPLGDSDTVQPRDDVLAVGNPSGMGLNITEGAISSVKTDRRTGKPWRLVHTAATMGGSSGGSVYKGSQVIGVHHAGIGDTEFGFAVPINLVKTLLENPKYDRQLLLTDVFSDDINSWGKKTKQVAATTGSVPAKPSRNKDGIWSANVQLLPQSDYAVVLKTPKNVDLDMTLWFRNQRIGLAAQRQNGTETLAVSNTGLGTMDASLQVHSGRSVPVGFALTLYKVEW